MVVNRLEKDKCKVNVDTASKHKNKQTRNIHKDIEDLSLMNMHKKDKHKNKQHNKDVLKAVANETEQRHTKCNHQSINALKINMNTFNENKGTSDTQN